MLNFQNWLDRIGQTFFRDDFEGYADAISVPFMLVTTTRPLVVQDAAELRAGYDAFRDMLRGLGATDVVRLATGVFPLGGTLISGSYDTHILRNGQRLFEPIRSAAVLRRDADGSWRASCIANSLANSRWPIHMPQIEADESLFATP